jgi:GNAT superfamily N-acetyltransferase
MNGEIEIVGYSPDYREEIRTICYNTGFAGVTLHDVMDKKKLFADLNSHYFTDNYREGIFVAVDRGKAVGYLFAEPDKIIYEHYLRGYYARRIMLEILRFWDFSYKDVRYYYRYVSAFFRGEFKFPDFSKEYPSVLHINITPGYHRMGIGTMLFDAMFGFLYQKGSRGVQLQTTSLNLKATDFYAKHGFIELHRVKTRFYEYWGKPDAFNVVFGKKLL